MKYLYLLYADESKMPAPGTPAFNAQNDAFNKYFEEINGKGLRRQVPGRQRRSHGGPPDRSDVARVPSPAARDLPARRGGQGRRSSPAPELPPASKPER